MSYPCAAAVRIDHGDKTPSQQSKTDYYANAVILDSFTEIPSSAATTTLIADPWDNYPLATSGEQPTIQALPDAHYEDPLAKKRRRRQRRRTRMAVSAVGGVFIGGIMLGPVGAVAGAVTAAAVTRGISKAGEKRKDERVQREVALQA
jgi:hypothetical protein